MDSFILRKVDNEKENKVAIVRRNFELKKQFASLIILNYKVTTLK